jgi:GNAT superfamily N-acetyltransferase
MERCVCSVVEGLEVVKGGWGDYEALGRFHYRGGPCRVYSATYALRDNHPRRRRVGGLVGVIVYVMPTVNLALRNEATGGMFAGFGDRRLQIQMVNENIRCIGRVIIEPRYRGLGLASRLVRETLPLAGVPMVEAMAVMGQINPFFEKAGMRAYRGRRVRRCAEMSEALGAVGIGEDAFVDPEGVQERIDSLGAGERGFVEGQIERFMQAYGKRKYMDRGIGRMRYVLSKLGERPVYYIWRAAGS